MNLILSKTYNFFSSINMAVENISAELILISIELKGHELSFDARPYHWRCDFGDFPPLDISLDSETGLIKEVTIFIRKKDIKITDKSKKLDLSVLKGYPSFDTSIWEENEYYMDNNLKVDISLSNRDMSILIQSKSPVQILTVNEALDIYFDNQNVFTGFVIKNLADNELNLLK